MNEIKKFMAQPLIKSKFEELLGKKSQGFITSVLQVCASNKLLSKADPMSIFQAAATAATLDLPINNNLGFAYIIPYNVKQEDGTRKQVAQFQIGYKGFKQLALRTGEFNIMHSSDVREGELIHQNRLTGEITFNWMDDDEARLKLPVIGFVSYFRLLSGYEHTLYMSVEEINAHGGKYSKTFKFSSGLWKTDFSSMALKTVTKLNLSKNAPLSIEMKTAIVTDQSVINNHETEDVEYVDNVIDVEDKKKLIDRGAIDELP